MKIPDEDLKKILAAIQRLIYDKDVRTEKDKEVIDVINRLTGDDTQ